MRSLLSCFLGLLLPLFGFEKLHPKYQVVYGDPKETPGVVEYFSFSCPRCIAHFNQEFLALKKGYIDTGKISWVFHADPADLLTLQAIHCLSFLSNEQKILFLETLMNHFPKLKTPEQKASLMQEAMRIFGHSADMLQDLSFLETTDAFQDAFSFLIQEDVVDTLPSTEIAGVLYTQTPTASFLKAHFPRLL